MRSILVSAGYPGRWYFSRGTRDNYVGTGTYICRSTSAYWARRNEKIGNRTQSSAVFPTILPGNFYAQCLRLSPIFHASMPPTLICLHACAISLLRPGIRSPRWKEFIVSQGLTTSFSSREIRDGLIRQRKTLNGTASSC